MAPLVLPPPPLPDLPPPGPTSPSPAKRAKMVDPDTPMAGAIDEDLHSRQLAVYGRESMLRMSQARILIHGLRGLGAEVAKNVILAGVAEVAMYDPHPVEISDLAAHFYLSERDVGQPRAQAGLAKLQELNPTVHVHVLDHEPTR